MRRFFRVDGELDDILYGDVECYVYKQNGGGTVLLVVNDSYNYTDMLTNIIPRIKMKDITKKIKKFEKEHLELIQNKLGILC